MNRFQQKAMQKASNDKRKAKKQGAAMVEYMRIINERKKQNELSADESMEGTETK